MGTAAKVTPYDVLTQRIIAELDAGTIPWRKPWAAHARPCNATTGRPYRGFNVLVTGMQGYSDPRWITFKQADKLGGKVREGESATPVAYWHFGDREREDGTVDQDVFLGVRYYRVFNVDQVDGLDRAKLADLPAAPAKSPSPIKSAEKIAANYRKREKVGIRHGASLAAYIPREDRVVMPKVADFQSESGYYSTLFHELTHSTGHPDRLKRFEIGEVGAFGSKSYSDEELTAEIGATFLLSEAGILDDFDVKQSAAYVDHWRKRLGDEPKVIVTAAQRAQRAADLILNAKPAKRDA